MDLSYLGNDERKEVGRFLRWLRMVLTGSDSGPDVLQIIGILGCEKSIQRIAKNVLLTMAAAIEENQLKGLKNEDHRLDQ